MTRVLGYLERESERVLLLYGEHDPWTACAVSLAPNGSNLRFIVPGRAHEFRLDGLPEEMKQQVESTLKHWLATEAGKDTRWLP